MVLMAPKRTRRGTRAKNAFAMIKSTILGNEQLSTNLLNDISYEIK